MPSTVRAAGRRPQQPAQHADRRGLAGAVAAEEPEHLAAPDVERHVVDGLERAERARQLLDLNRPARRSPVRPGQSLAPHRAQQARLAEPQRGLQARVFEFGFEQRDLRVEHFGAGGDAGAEALVDHAPGLGGRGHRLGRRRDRRAAGLEIEQPLPNLERDQVRRTPSGARRPPSACAVSAARLGLGLAAVEQRPGDIDADQSRTSSTRRSAARSACSGAPAPPRPCPTTIRPQCSPAPPSPSERRPALRAVSAVALGRAAQRARDRGRPTGRRRERRAARQRLIDRASWSRCACRAARRSAAPDPARPAPRRCAPESGARTAAPRCACADSRSFGGSTPASTRAFTSLTYASVRASDCSNTRTRVARRHQPPVRARGVETHVSFDRRPIGAGGSTRPAPHPAWRPRGRTHTPGRSLPRARDRCSECPGTAPRGPSGVGSGTRRRGSPRW